MSSSSSSSSLRIPFREAVEEKLLLKARWEQLSEPQKVILLALYGEELSQEQQEIWAMLQGGWEFDELGFPTRKILGAVEPYTPRQYREGWIIAGRRSGKSDRIASTIVAYEAACGGHERFLSKGQPALCFQIAQDLRMARYALNFIRAALEDSPLLKKLIKQITADRIDLSNQMVIYSVPATLKSVRGYASPIAVLDEVGVWWQDADSANPDYEIYRALSPAQLQFEEPKIVGISSPWNKAGLLWRFFEAGTGGSKIAARTGKTPPDFASVMVAHAPTAMMQNPLVTREYLAAERARDLRAFERECLALFQDSISGFFPPALVEQAIEGGVAEHAPVPGRRYLAAMDPAFKRDAFALTIVWNEGNQVRQAAIRRWVAKADQPLNPREVLAEIADLCRAFGISVIHTDQYHLESLTQLALDFGLSLWGINFTAKSKAQLYGNLQQLFAQGRIKLLDHPEQTRELKALERTLSQGGQVLIAAPPGLHDDLATVLTLAAGQALWEGAASPEPAPGPPQSRNAEILQRIDEQIRRVAVADPGEWWM